MINEDPDQLHFMTMSEFFSGIINSLFVLIQFHKN